MTRMPTLFLSHGAPDLALHPELPAIRFLAGLSAQVPRPQAIVVCSAHWEADVPTIESGISPQTIHDFSGFPESLYRRRYPARGSAAVVERLREVLGDWSPRCVERGYDHGVWVPLSISHPAADVPVLAISLVAGDRATERHWRLGHALAPLTEEGVLVIGSGSATHNLRELGHGAPAAWAVAFDTWLAERVVAGDAAALLDYRAQAPEARRNHPTEEHLLPFFVALGAAGPSARGQVLHQSMTYGSLSMAAYAWQS